MSHTSVTIVGAGPGGLASAMLLAASGCQVQVIERQPQPGGRTSTIEIDGYRFDMGPTFFLFPEVLEGIFASCGRDLHEEVDLIRLDPNYRLAFEGGPNVDASSDPAAMARELAKLSPADAARFPDYVADNRKKLDAFRPILESPFNSHLDLLKLPLAKLASLVRPWRSVDRDLKQHFEDPRVRLALSFQSKYLGMSPYTCPSLFTILAYLEHAYGVFHPRGGCAAITRAMYRIAREMGVQFHLNEAVESLEFSGRRVTGVRTDRATYQCDALVMNAEFATAMRRLVPERLRRKWTDAKIESSKMSCSTFMLYLGIDGHYENLPHHTIFLSEDYENNLRDIEQRRCLPTNPSFYVHNPSLLDDAMAPAGQSALYVLLPVPHQGPGVDWAAAKTRFAETALDQLAKVGLGDLRSRIRVRKIVTPDDWAAEMLLFKGATFSMAHSLDQMLSLRPHNRYEDLEAVYLVGGGTHPGSGLPVIFESAKISSQLLAEDFGLANAPMGRPARQAGLSLLAGESA